MPRSGHDEKRLIAERAIVLAAFVGVIATAFAMRGFTVDDAWIPLRYAAHIAKGAGYRFNVAGPSTDGVTPLPWAWMLAPLAKGDPVGAFIHVKYIELALWAATAVAWAHRVARATAPRWAKIAAVLGLAVSLPVAAHAASGLETGVVMCLATLAAVSATPLVTVVLASLAAAFRPELAPWAAVLSACMLAREAKRPVHAGARALVGAISGASGFAIVAVLRAVAFGHVAPLAVLAKPSDLSHGVMYAAAAAMVSVGPIAALAPRALAREGARGAALAAAGVTHLVAIVAVGGDWMPYARLVAPIVPSLLYAGVLASRHGSRAAHASRWAIAIALGAVTFARAAPAGLDVLDAETRIVSDARPVLASARAIACVDVGWVGAATDATLVDLAGLTDPEIAALPGGHTSKRVDVSMLLARDVDVVLLYSANGGASGDAWGRVTEVRLFESPLFARHYARAEFLPMGDAGAGYAVFRARSAIDSEP